MGRAESESSGVAAANQPAMLWKKIDTALFSRSTSISSAKYSWHYMKISVLILIQQSTRSSKRE
eukprot:5721026-Ditylum_brightwellii.AAC.1